MKLSRKPSTRLLFSQLLLGSMMAAVMSAAYADDNDAQHQAERRAELNKQRAGMATQSAMASSQASGMHFMPLAPRIQPTPAPQPQAHQVQMPQNSTPQSHGFQNNQPHTQPTIQNAPVGFNRTNNSMNVNPTPPTRYQGNNQPQGSQPQGSQSSGSRWNHDSDRQHDWHDQGRDQGSQQGFNNGVRFNNNVSFNNSINPNQNTSFHRDFDHDSHFNSDWDRRYRMPYRRGDSGAYRIRYVQSWPSNYGWRVHGWRRDYRTVDPYWFALITSIAVAQAWSDAEVTQAINDDNLRQQLIYDDAVRQQMIDSGYPADQVDYPDDYSSDSYAGQYDDQGPYGQSPYPTPYSQGQVTIQSTQSGYYPPPNQPAPITSNYGASYVSPSSPLYGNNQNVNSQSSSLASGEQIANLNANKNALFFCTAGNKPATIQAMSQIQKTDLSVWKTMERFDRCAAWATP